jgi:hypothetical protein
VALFQTEAGWVSDGAPGKENRRDGRRQPGLHCGPPLDGVTVTLADRARTFNTPSTCNDKGKNGVVPDRGEEASV